MIREESIYILKKNLQFVVVVMKMLHSKARPTYTKSTVEVGFNNHKYLLFTLEQNLITIGLNFHSKHRMSTVINRLLFFHQSH